MPCDDVLAEARAAAAPLSSGSLDIALRQYARFFLESDILFKVDRAGMAHGLEIRSPYLDHELAGYVASLPGALKLTGRTRKSLLRRALADGIPPAVLARPKQGFSVPILRWINGELLPARISAPVCARRIRSWHAVRKEFSKCDSRAISVWKRHVPLASACGEDVSPIEVDAAAG